MAADGHGDVTRYAAFVQSLDGTSPQIVEEQIRNASLPAGRVPGLADVHDWLAVVMEDKVSRCDDSVTLHPAGFLAIAQDGFQVCAHHGNDSWLACLGVQGFQFDFVAMHVVPFERADFPGSSRTQAVPTLTSPRVGIRPLSSRTGAF